MRPLKKLEEKLVVLKCIMTAGQADKLWNWVGKLGLRSCSMKESEPKVGDAIAIEVGEDGHIK